MLAKMKFLLGHSFTDGERVKWYRERVWQFPIKPNMPLLYTPLSFERLS